MRAETIVPTAPSAGHSPQRRASVENFAGRSTCPDRTTDKLSLASKGRKVYLTVDVNHLLKTTFTISSTFGYTADREDVRSFQSCIHC